MIALNVQASVRFSAHAVNRYCERVAIAIDPATAERDISDLVSFAEISASPPEMRSRLRK